MVRAFAFIVCIALSVCTAVVAGQNLDLNWYTVDGGGTMFSMGGEFELGGSIAQPDAGILSGGSFTLAGGFWPGATAPACTCPGDLNADGYRNGGDIQQFVDCLLTGASCTCADIDGSSDVSLEDADALVAQLLSSHECQ